MNIADFKTCLVVGCKRSAKTTWEPLMHLHRAEVPVRRYHFKFGDDDAPGWLEKEPEDEKPYDAEEPD